MEKLHHYIFPNQHDLLNQVDNGIVLISMSFSECCNHDSLKL